MRPGTGETGPGGGYYRRGQALGLRVVPTTHRSRRVGGLPFLTLKRVYLPILPGLVTKIEMLTPAEKRRWKRLNRTARRGPAAAILAWRRPCRGQRRPRQMIRSRSLGFDPPPKTPRHHGS